eukprot:CAMPEP_0181298536 /NCGR_PEP_ID=MMETSP1101-20121128/5836_1 /TAXON_ID=46948 /ORGANISM="Rhodomonas abbreviata, Strain Caron Lab Isolate" /LENGTH=964 /DNA_ID=CAMNT_0023403567 /DNA_START=29 /DNA_END=2920 /DNA_ORIENTATION=+
MVSDHMQPARPPNRRDAVFHLAGKSSGLGRCSFLLLLFCYVNPVKPFQPSPASWRSPSPRLGGQTSLHLGPHPQHENRQHGLTLCSTRRQVSTLRLLMIDPNTLSNAIPACADAANCIATAANQAVSAVPSAVNPSGTTMVVPTEIAAVVTAVVKLKATILALPAAALKTPEVASALKAVNAFLAQSGLAKAPALLQKQLQPLQAALKPYASYAETARASLTLDRVLSFLPPQVQQAEKAAEKAAAPFVKYASNAIRVISHDNDKDLFNGYPFNPKALALWAGSVFAFSSIAFKDDEVPYKAGQYDPIKAEKFFAKRWAIKYGRAVQLAQTLGGWGIGLARDKYEYGGKNWERNMPMRAKQILRICTKLGTTAIKIGQALSIRGDILPAPYVKELSELQDKVPPFSTKIAKEIISEELKSIGKGSVKDVFGQLSSAPIASASIGQVYKGVLEDGTEVAIKVQRPDVVLDIALDLYFCRIIAPVYKRALKLNTDLVGLIDEWGAGFVNELDYQREAYNGKRFLEAMEKRGLDAVTTSEVVDELSTGRILVTKWVDGERLASSSAGDVGRLCGVALNAYLTMLLDTGLLHCDPHPGNFLRTTDGRLCILDFGMCIEVEKDLQYGLIEYIAHLVSEDYAAIPGDLIKLGFVPPGKEAAIQQAGVVEALSIILKQLAEGGGPKKVQGRIEKAVREEFGDLPREELRIAVREKMQQMNKQDIETRVNVGDVAKKMEEMERDQNAFQIPPWMAYILRTFTVLEGVGLAQDEDYSITQECYPYLARRLFTDNSPRAQLALRQMLYGAGGQGQERLNVERLQELTEGFQTYTVSTSSTSNSVGMEVAADQAVELLLSPEGNFIQQVILEEVAAVLDAAGRQAITQATRNPLGQAAIELFKQQHEASQQIPGPLRTALGPLLLPGELILGAIPLLESDEEDETSLETAGKLLAILQSQALPEQQRAQSSEVGG